MSCVHCVRARPAVQGCRARRGGSVPRARVFSHGIDAVPFGAACAHARKGRRCGDYSPAAPVLFPAFRPGLGVDQHARALRRRDAHTRWIRDQPARQGVCARSRAVDAALAALPRAHSRAGAPALDAPWRQRRERAEPRVPPQAEAVGRRDGASGH